MTPALLPLLAAASLCRAADPAALKAADALYLERHEDASLKKSTDKLEALLKAEPESYDLLWRAGRNKVAAGARKDSKGAKLQAFAEAAQALREAIKVNDSGKEGHYWLAAELGQENAIRRTLGLAKQMKRELETALKIDPRYADAHQLYCELLRQLPGMFGGDKKKAVDECEQALRLTPDETSRYPALAEAYLAVKRQDDAVAALKKVFAVKTPADPGSAPGDLQAARELLRKLTGSPQPK
jgi:tetratricopeptide (TPR) repeat protein